MLQTLIQPIHSLDSDRLISLLQIHGALLIRHSEHNVKQFMLGTEPLCTDFLKIDETQPQIGSVGANFGRQNVKGYASLFQATGQSQGYALPLHGEGYFHFKTPPDSLFFFCVQAAQSKGETWICHGGQLFESLPPTMQKQLQAEIVYYRHHPPQTLQHLFGTQDYAQLLPFFKARGIQSYLKEDGSVETEFYSSALQKRMGKNIFINNILPFALRELYSPEETRARVRFVSGAKFSDAFLTTLIEKSLSLREAVSWEKGDILILDNRLYLHGRDQIQDPERKLYLRLGYRRELKNALQPDHA